MDLFTGLLDKNSEEYRHQCEVRCLIAMRVNKGKQWLVNHLNNPKLARRSQKLALDIQDQWKKGNRGEYGVWL